jgi:hypothetical protein
MVSLATWKALARRKLIQVDTTFDSIVMPRTGAWATITPAGRAILATEAAPSESEELARLRAILDTPILEPFAEAVTAEARHQIYRWGADHDAKKTAWDWFWTLGHLGSKAAHSALSGDLEKAKHHTITAAALLANWHRHLITAQPDTTKSGGEG